MSAILGKPLTRASVEKGRKMMMMYSKPTNLFRSDWFIDVNIHVHPLILLIK